MEANRKLSSAASLSTCPGAADAHTGESINNLIRATDGVLGLLAAPRRTCTACRGQFPKLWDCAICGQATCARCPCACLLCPSCASDAPALHQCPVCHVVECAECREMCAAQRPELSSHGQVGQR